MGRLASKWVDYYLVSVREEGDEGVGQMGQANGQNPFKFPMADKLVRDLNTNRDRWEDNSLKMGPVMSEMEGLQRRNWRARKGSS